MDGLPTHLRYVGRDKERTRVFVRLQNAEVRKLTPAYGVESGLARLSRALRLCGLHFRDLLLVLHLYARRGVPRLCVRLDARFCALHPCVFSLHVRGSPVRTPPISRNTPVDCRRYIHGNDVPNSSHARVAHANI